jgi:hypothetical protein
MASAFVTGTPDDPEIELVFDYDERHPNGKLLREWVKRLPGATWDSKRKLWRLTDPEMLAPGELKRAGITVLRQDGSVAKRHDTLPPPIVHDPPPAADPDDLKVPSWFGLALMEDQDLAARTVASGHWSECDSPGAGKGSPEWELLLTPNGWRTYGDIRVGDFVIGGNGQPTRVVGVYPRGELDVFRVTLSDASSVVVDGDHLWEVQDIGERKLHQHPRVRSTRELLRIMAEPPNAHRAASFIPIVEPVHFRPRSEPLPLDPYVLGVLLGDGSLSGFTSVDEELVKTVESRLPQGTHLVLWKNVARRPMSYHIAGRGPRRQNLAKQILNELGIMGHRAETKFVPNDYLLSAPEDRLALLRGLCDTDGSAGATGAEYTTVSPRLASDVEFLVRSLGGTTRRSVKQTSYGARSGERVKGRPVYRIWITMPARMNPFLLSRKANAWHEPWKYGPMRAIRSIEPAGRERVICIAVDAQDQLYVTRDFIVTHNTRVILAVAAILGPRRVVVLCPPVVTTHWLRETAASGLAKHCLEKPGDVESRAFARRDSDDGVDKASAMGAGATTFAAPPRPVTPAPGETERERTALRANPPLISRPPKNRLRSAKPQVSAVV